MALLQIKYEERLDIFMARVVANIFFWLKNVWKMNWKMVVVSGFRMIFQMIEPYCMIIFPSLILNEISVSKNPKKILLYIIVMASTYAICNVVIALLNHLLILEDMKSGNEFGRMLAYKHMTMLYEKCESDEALNLLQKFYFPLQPDSFLRTIESVLSAIIQVIIILITGSFISIYVVAVIVGFMVIQNVIVRQIKKLEMKYQDEQASRGRKMKYICDILTEYSFSKDIHINGGSKWLRGMFEELLETYMGCFSKFTSKMSSKRFILNLIDMAQELSFMIIIGAFIIVNSLAVGYYTLGIGFANRLKGSTSSIIDGINTLRQTSEYIDLYREYDGYVPNTMCETEEVDSEKIEIEFHNVSFVYPGSDCPALENINLKITSGSKVALVGENGSGKTTLCKLICRLYHPTSGIITLNGRDIFSYKSESYLQMLSVFLQDYKLMALRIRDNIAYDTVAPDEILLNCLDEAGLKNKVVSLPNTLETYLFKDFSDEGIELSGGESQKLIYARELYKNRRFVILDEPTAALDPVAEYEFYDQIRRLSNNNTYLYISHRLYGVRFADSIYVFKNGRIIEHGDHKSLMDAKGEYYMMFSKQACLYNKVVS